MRKIFLIFFSLFLLFSFAPSVFAKTQQSPKDTFLQASVISISPENKILEVKLISGNQSGKKVKVTYEPGSSGKINLQDTVVVAQAAKIGSSKSQYYYVDEYRISPLIFIAIGFFIFILLIVGWKGVGSIAGLIISLGIIFLYILPQIIAGADPLTVCVIGAVVILFVTTFMAHGISQQTTTALIGTLLALVATLFISQFVTHLSLLTGYGNEEAVDLQFALIHPINLRGLYLGGIILATLGALNDITITQATAIFSLNKANPSLSFKELATEGYIIGREHALSLVNTLLLAFAGSALALFIFVLANPNGEPLWVILNSEFFIEEIIKIIVGTGGLLLSVPIVTLLAALICDKGVRASTSSIFTAFFK